MIKALSICIHQVDENSVDPDQLAAFHQRPVNLDLQRVLYIDPDKEILLA